MEAFAVRPWTSDDRSVFDFGPARRRARRRRGASIAPPSISSTGFPPRRSKPERGTIQDPFNDLAAELESVLLRSP